MITDYFAPALGDDVEHVVDDFGRWDGALTFEFVGRSRIDRTAVPRSAAPPSLLHDKETHRPLLKKSGNFPNPSRKASLRLSRRRGR